MDDLTIATMILAGVTFAGVVVAIWALWRAGADAKAARIAELSWNVYRTYDSPELRKGRRALNIVSHKEPVPCSGKQFGDYYVTHSYETPRDRDVGAHAEKVSTGSIRRILRFYQQVGILLDKNLIDADFVFPLIGDGLETSKEGIRVAVDWHQNYYGGESGNDLAEPPRTIYQKAKELPDEYMKWKPHRPSPVTCPHCGHQTWVREHYNDPCQHCGKTVPDPTRTDGAIANSSPEANARSCR